MTFSPEFIILQDSVDVESQEQIILRENPVDTIRKDSQGDVYLADTTRETIKAGDSIVVVQQKHFIENVHKVEQSEKIQKDTISSDTLTAKSIHDIEKFERYHLFNESQKTFDYKPLDIFYTEKDTLKISGNTLEFRKREAQQSKLNWTLIIGFISIFLFIILKTYYQKSLTQIVNTLVNFQLSEKILREKNIIVRRAFFILNINYIFIFSLFVLLILKLYNFHIDESYFVSYLMITGFVILVLLARLIILYLTGIVFNSLAVISEYIHNIYLINKNVGIILLPVIFISLYTPEVLSKIILLTALGIVSVATIFKYIRGLQIIIKNDILKFYSFLYLCTLEVLPLVVCYKIIITLR